MLRFFCLFLRCPEILLTFCGAISTLKNREGPSFSGLEGGIGVSEFSFFGKSVGRQNMLKVLMHNATGKEPSIRIGSHLLRFVQTQGSIRLKDFSRYFGFNYPDAVVALEVLEKMELVRVHADGLVRVVGDPCHLRTLEIDFANAMRAYIYDSAVKIVDRENDHIEVRAFFLGDGLLRDVTASHPKLHDHAYTGRESYALAAALSLHAKDHLRQRIERFLSVACASTKDAGRIMRLIEICRHQGFLINKDGNIASFPIHCDMRLYFSLLVWKPRSDDEARGIDPSVLERLRAKISRQLEPDKTTRVYAHE